MVETILTTGKKENEKFLRKKTVAFTFEKWKPAEMRKLVSDMRDTMRAARGIGLSANQIGRTFRMFVAEVPSEHGMKFYAIFNPVIERKSKETVVQEEGCLSIPGVYGPVERPERVTLSGFDKQGKPLKIKAWGLLARVFQHEVDHLDGVLFIDRAKETYTVIPHAKS